jgi:hypothetical protein
MKLNLLYLLPLAPLVMIAVGGALGAQLLVLGLTLAIFFGTLSLGKPEASDATTTNH